MTPTALPSVLLLLSDDYPRNLLAAYGASHGLTPTIDKVAQAGLTFEHAYTTAPLCTPSRYSLLTGRYASTAAEPRCVCEAHPLSIAIQSIVSPVLQIAAYQKKSTTRTWDAEAARARTTMGTSLRPRVLTQNIWCRSS